MPVKRPVPPPENVPTYEDFLAWSRAFGLPVEDWDKSKTGTSVQFWTFFCYGWRASSENLANPPTSPPPPRKR